MSTTVIACRASDPHWEPIFGARPHPCSGCDEEVMLAPSSRRMVDEEGMLVLCMQCAAAQQRLEGKPWKMRPITQEQRAEMDAYRRGYS